MMDVVNVQKTREMVIGAATLNDPPSLVLLNGAHIDRAVAFELHGVGIDTLPAMKLANNKLRKRDVNVKQKPIALVWNCST